MMSVEVDMDEGSGSNFMGPCRVCGQPLDTPLVPLFGKFYHGTVHDHCMKDLDAQWKATVVKQGAKSRIPDKFRFFEAGLFKYPQAMHAAQAFDPDSSHKILIIYGLPSRGKSRLMWAVIQEFFDAWGAGKPHNKWVDYFSFCDLMTEYDQAQITKIKQAQFVFIDDIGSVESYGRARGQLQAVIRSRIQQGRWTFLTVDDKNFDPGLPEVCAGRSVIVTIDQ